MSLAFQEIDPVASAAMIDHASLKPDVSRFCADARARRSCSVSVKPDRVREVARTRERGSDPLGDKDHHDRTVSRRQAH